MIGIIPVKKPARLENKHLLKLGNYSILKIIYDEVSSVMETVIYSKIDLSLPYVPDRSDNIIDLVLNLSAKYHEFFLIGGDMPFFTIDDLQLMMGKFSGKILVPIHSDHSFEPLFCIYSGDLKKGKSLREVILQADYIGLRDSLFSKYAFFNVNTEEDYQRAISIYDSLNKPR